ncbi:MAG: hypothetical protein ACD_59C00053G0018 [uncultured bacterium]|nr:MAG: hypothetical protein ACD_59C00053G0018 [uncultured bacterium]
MSNELVLAKRESFGNVTCDFYKQGKEVFMTRTQIGEALGYENPAAAIKDIHSRNKERLDEFSTKRKMRQVENGREVEREVILYTAKGVYEICRYSQQKKANDFYDFVYEVLEALRTKSHSMLPTEELQQLRAVAMGKNADARVIKANNERARMIMETAEKFRASLSPEAVQSMINHATEIMTGHRLLPDPKIESGKTPAEIAKELGTNKQVIGIIISKLGIRPTVEQGGKNEYAYTFLGQALNVNKE